jgi:acetoacetate decarboxylase
VNAVLTEEHSHGNEYLDEPGVMTGGQDLYTFPGCLSSPPCFTKNLFITFGQEY